MRTLTVASTVAAGLAAGRWLRRRLVVVSIEGESMEPALLAGDRVLVVRRPSARLSVGDVVVVAHETTGPPSSCARDRDSVPRPRDAGWLVKRIAALPGDPMPASVGSHPQHGAVPSGHLVVLGDNAAVSLDSRQTGPFALTQVMGRVEHRMVSRRPRPAASAAVRPPHRPVARPAHNEGDQ